MVDSLDMHKLRDLVGDKADNKVTLPYQLKLNSKKPKKPVSTPNRRKHERRLGKLEKTAKNKYSSEGTDIFCYKNLILVYSEISAFCRLNEK